MGLCDRGEKDLLHWRRASIARADISASALYGRSVFLTWYA